MAKRFFVWFLLVGITFLFTACGTGNVISKESQLDALAVLCSVSPQNAHRSFTVPSDIAGKAAGPCTNTNSALGGPVWVEFYVSLQKLSGSTWTTVSTQSPAVRKTIGAGQTVSWTNTELRAFTRCSPGTYRTVVNGRASVLVSLGLPKYGSSQAITCP